MDLILLPFRRYFEFSGRSRRLEFGVFVLFNIAMSVVLRAVDIQTGTFSVAGQVGFLGGLYGLFIIIPGIALGVRRLHDMNASGWWYLLTLIPLVNFILFLVLLLKSGSQGPNRFGADPKEPAF